MLPLISKQNNAALEKTSSFTNVLGGINRRWKARIDWRNHINGFDMFAVPKGRANWRRFLKIFDFSAVPTGKGKLEKISIRISSIYIVPATAALQRGSDDPLFVFLRHT